MKDTVGSCIVGRVSQSGQVKCTPKGSINEFVIDWIQRGYCKKFTAHYRCRKADLNLIMSAANGFIFQVADLLMEPVGVCLTVWHDCKAVSNFIIEVRDRTRDQGPVSQKARKLFRPKGKFQYQNLLNSSSVPSSQTSQFCFVNW